MNETSFVVHDGSFLMVDAVVMKRFGLELGQHVSDALYLRVLGENLSHGLAVVRAQLTMQKTNG